MQVRILKDKKPIDLRHWHDHYSILPRVIERHFVWLEMVERRYVECELSYDDYHGSANYYQYRLKENK